MPAPLTVALVLALLVGLLAAATWAGRRFDAPPELVRKSVHILMGGACMTFPLWFTEPLPVIWLAALATSGLLLVRLHRGLRNRLGGLHQVKRLSMGELYFPLGVAALFTLTHDDALLYVIPLLLLTLGDSAGALVGTRWGRRRFRVPGGTKSVEGFAATYLVCFLCVLVPLGVSGRADWPLALIIALMLAALAAMLESTSGSGLDNLILPLVGYALLDRYLALELPALLARLALVLGLLGALYRWHHLTTLNGGGILGAILYCYVALALGGPAWVLAPLMIHAFHMVLLLRCPRLRRPMHDAAVVLTLAGGGLVWLVVAIEALFPPGVAALGYSLWFAAHACMIRVRHRRERGLSRGSLPGAALEGLVVGAMSMAALLLWPGQTVAASLPDGTGWRLWLLLWLPALWGLAWLFRWWDQALGGSGGTRSWLSQAALALLFSAALTAVTTLPHGPEAFAPTKSGPTPQILPAAGPSGPQFPLQRRHSPCSGVWNQEQLDAFGGGKPTPPTLAHHPMMASSAPVPEEKRSFSSPRCCRQDTNRLDNGGGRSGS